MVSHTLKRVTIADVAREAGVSRTTVSHSLNGLGQVDARTRARVQEVAAQLNYRPSVRAQRLRQGRSHTIALLSSMPAAVSAGPAQLGFFTELAMGCARTALLSGYVLVLAPPIQDHNPLGQLDIDGAILLEPLPQDPLAHELTDRGIPYVTIDGPESETSVDLHHEQSADLLLEHLLECGTRSIGLIVGTSGRRAQRVFQERYLAVSERAAFTPVIAEADEADGEAGGYETAARLLAAHPELDALCVPIDAFASGAARAALEAGRVIGKDLLLATRYDGLRARTNSPALTAIDLQLEQISAASVDRLLTLLGDTRPDEQTGSATAPDGPTLVVRESTRR